jgi:hypothetical protein
MSNTWAKVAFAFLVVLASPGASFAREAGAAATGNVPITTIDPNGVGKCFQAKPATPALRSRPGIVHSVCWGPRNITDGPGV